MMDFYECVICRYRQTSERLKILNTSSWLMRLLIVSIYGFLFIEYVPNAYEMDVPLKHLFAIAFGELLLTRVYAVLASDQMTNNKIFTSQRVYPYSHIRSYQWVNYGPADFNRREVQYDELVLLMKKEGWLDKVFKNRKGYEVRLKIPKKDRESALDFIKRYAINLE